MTVADLGDFAPRRLAIDTRYLGPNRETTIPPQHRIEAVPMAHETIASIIPGAQVGVIRDSEH